MSMDGYLPWGDMWDHAFAPTYGAIDWESTRPPEVFKDDGTLADGAWAPYIQQVVDGDTLVVSREETGRLFGGRLRGGRPQMHKIRLIGINAAEWDTEQGPADTERLTAVLYQALEDGKRIYLVRDRRFGNVDIYGRELAWLFIDDEAYYFEDHFNPRFDPSGGAEPTPSDEEPAAIEEVGAI